MVRFASNDILYNVDLPFHSSAYMLQTSLCVCMCTCMHMSESDWVILFGAMFPKLFIHAFLVVLEVLHKTSSEKWKLMWNRWGAGRNGACRSFALTGYPFQIPARLWGILPCVFFVFLTPSRAGSGWFIQYAIIWFLCIPFIIHNQLHISFSTKCLQEMKHYKII